MLNVTVETDTLLAPLTRWDWRLWLRGERLHLLLPIPYLREKSRTTEGETAVQLYHPSLKSACSQGFDLNTTVSLDTIQHIWVSIFQWTGLHFCDWRSIVAEFPDITCSGHLLFYVYDLIKNELKYGNKLTDTLRTKDLRIPGQTESVGVRFASFADIQNTCSPI